MHDPSPPTTLRAIPDDPVFGRDNPAEGETGVPTDAVFWFIFDGGTNIEVWLDEEALEPSHIVNQQAAAGYSSGGLEPAADYEITVVTVSLFPHGEQAFSVAFRTGSGALRGSVQSPVIVRTRRRTSDDHLSAMCRELISAQGCFDMGPYVHHVLEMNEEAIAWLVIADDGSEEHNARGSLLWPGECGPPSFLAPRHADRCFVAYAIDEAGNLAASDRRCVRGLPMLPSWSCLSEPGSTTSAVVLVILGFLLARSLFGPGRAGDPADTT